MKPLGRCLIFLCVSGLLLLSAGCWSRREMDELGIVMGTAIDTSPEGYLVTLQYVDPSQMSRNRQADRIPTLTYTQSGRTINEAVRRITEKTSRYPYGRHLRFVVISQQIAKKELESILDYFSRSVYIRPDFYLAIAKGTAAKDLMRLVTPLEVIPSVELHKALELSERSWAPTTATRLADIVFTATTPGKEIGMTALTLKGDKKIGGSQENVKTIANKAEYVYDGIAVFRGYEFQGYLNEDDSKAYNYILNKVQATSAVERCPNGNNFDLQVVRSSCRIIPELTEGVPRIGLKLKVEANLNQYTCDLDLTNDYNIQLLEGIAKERAKEILERAIKHTQEQYGTDIYGFGEAFYRKYPKAWRDQLGHDWNQRYFAKLPVDVQVEIHIRKLGKIHSGINKPK